MYGPKTKKVCANRNILHECLLYTRHCAWQNTAVKAQGEEKRPQTRFSDSAHKDYTRRCDSRQWAARTVKGLSEEQQWTHQILEPLLSSFLSVHWAWAPCATVRPCLAGRMKVGPELQFSRGITYSISSFKPSCHSSSPRLSSSCISPTVTSISLSSQLQKLVYPLEFSKTNPHCILHLCVLHLCFECSFTFPSCLAVLLPLSLPSYHYHKVGVRCPPCPSMLPPMVSFSKTPAESWCYQSVVPTNPRPAPQLLLITELTHGQPALTVTLVIILSDFTGHVDAASSNLVSYSLTSPMVSSSLPQPFTTPVVIS